jgi:hypothetical protein
VPLVGFGYDDVAGSDHLNLTVTTLDTSDSLNNTEYLADWMAVPSGAGAWREMHTECG